MALLPAHLPHQTALSDQKLEALASLVNQGLHPRDIARKLHPDDRAARNRTRRHIEATMLRDDNFLRRLTARARIEQMVGLGPAVRALNKRASGGRIDAIKLLFEASGFHNPRVQHEHSGEITFKVDIPRPKFVDATAVEDAEVVPPTE